MTRCVSGFLILILLPLMPLSSLFAQSVTFSNPDWITLLSEYQTLKVQWERSNKLVQSLESSLQQAKSSQETSGQIIEDSESRITDLERRLQAALISRDRLQEQVLSLEQQLTELGISLVDTKLELDRSTEKHQNDVIQLVEAHEREKTLLRLGLIAAAVLVVVEGVVIAVQLVTK